MARDRPQIRICSIWGLRHRQFPRTNFQLLFLVSSSSGDQSGMRLSAWIELKAGAQYDERILIHHSNDYVAVAVPSGARYLSNERGKPCIVSALEYCSEHGQIFPTQRQLTLVLYRRSRSRRPLRSKSLPVSISVLWRSREAR